MLVTNTELTGRQKIYTVMDNITEDNVLEVINSALIVHLTNMSAMEYLYWYRRGFQDVIERRKEVRPEICNKIIENHAEEIVAFKNGYFLTSPATYVARGKKSGAIKKLNEFLYRSGKHVADNKIVDWFHTVGKGCLYVEPTEDKDAPVKAYCLDPRNSFVVYSRRPDNKPMLGVNMVVDADGKVIFDVFTENNLFRLQGGYNKKPEVSQGEGNLPIQATAFEITEVSVNVLGKIPIIEYWYNSVGMGAFENVIPLLNAINLVTSNQMDGIEQFVQSLCLAINCSFDEGVTANDIRQAGMLILKSIGENKADFQILSEQLDQSQTQAYKTWLYEKMLTIVGMPTTSKGGSSTSDTGSAVLYRDGWQQAENCARNTEDIFLESNRYFDEIFLEILKKKTDLNIDINDFQLQFVRNESANIQSKAQACGTMLGFGMSPELAFAKSGISSDPVSDVSASKGYLDMRWGDPKAKQQTLNAENQVQQDAQAIQNGNKNQNNEQNDNQGKESAKVSNSGNHKDGYEAKWDKGQSDGIKYNKDK